MRRKTRIRLVRWLKWGWIVANILILHLSFTSCSSTCTPDLDCYYRAPDAPIEFVIVSGFPGSLLAMLASASLFGIRSFRFEYVPLWSAGVIGGYVQWFVLLPRLVKATKPITLGISRIRHTPTAVNAAIEKTISKEILIDAIPEKITRKIRKKPAKFSDQIPQFDTKGRTPLERALAGTKLRS